MTPFGATDLLIFLPTSFILFSPFVTSNLYLIYPLDRKAKHHTIAKVSKIMATTTVAINTTETVSTASKSGTKPPTRYENIYLH